MEARSKSRIKDIDKFEILQRKIIRQIFVLFQSTPYWGVVAACDIWSRKGCVNRKKWMWCYSLLQSPLARKVLLQQKHDRTTTSHWYKISKVVNTYIKVVESNSINKIFGLFDEKRATIKKLQFIKINREDKLSQKSYNHKCSLKTHSQAWDNFWQLKVL